MGERQLRVLRLCSVFHPPDGVLRGRGARFDPVGGMQNHTGQLTRFLDERGVVQTILTARPAGAARQEPFARSARVIRVGFPFPWLRQLYSVPASVLAPALAARADLVHVHLGEDIAIVPIALAAARLHRLPLVLTVHCSPGHTVRPLDLRSAVLRTLGGSLEHVGERAADRVLVLTSRLASLLARAGVRPDRIRRIPLGVDRSAFGRNHPRPLPQLPGRRVVYAGRLVRSKGIRDLVSAFAQLKASDAHLVLVGDGPERPAVARHAGRLGIGHRVHVTGFVPHASVPGYLRSADVLVLPSVYEELGRVAVEGMAAGVPVVASRTGGLPDLVSDGVNGLLVPPGSPVPLAGAIDRVLADPDLAGRLRRGGGATAAEHDLEALGTAVLETYHECISVRGRARGPRTPFP